MGIMTKSSPSDTRKLTRKIPGNLVLVLKEQGRLRLRQRTDVQGKAQLAPAFYVGRQEGSTQVAGFSLYTLMQEIPGHPQWSTVSGKTLEDAGFILPPRGTGREQDLERRIDK